MPFLNEGIRDYIGHRQLPTIETILTELETQRGAPVRMLELGNEGRDRHGHTSWRGGARRLEHYAEGTTEEDFATKGISIFMRAWNNNQDDVDGAEPEWFYHDFPMADLIVEGLGRYETREALPDNVNLEIYGYDANKINGFADATVLETNGVVFGEMYDEGRCIYLNSGFYNLFGYGIPDWQKILVEPVLAAGDPELLAQIAEQQKERAKRAFFVMMQDRGDAAIAEARNMMDQFAIEYAEMQEKLVNARGNRDQYARQLTWLLDQEGDLTDEMVAQEWAGIENNTMIERFTAGEGKWTPAFGNGQQQPNPWLKVYTKDLWITNPDNGRKMPLGKYEVTMNFGENTLRIKNLTMQQTGGTAFNYREGDRWDHPHVKNGKLCTAEYATAITTLLRDRKLAQMTNMMFSILSTLTLNDDWGRNNIRLWEAADDELRTEKGWPAWEAGETEHPMAAQTEEVTDNA